MNDQMDAPKAQARRVEKRSGRSLKLIIISIIIAVIIWILNLMGSMVRDVFDTTTCYVLVSPRPAPPALVIPRSDTREALLERLLAQGSLPEAVVDVLSERV
jgi:hypothetical protein